MFSLSLSAEKPYKLPSSFPGRFIAVLVLVPLLAVIFIFFAVVVRRRYEQKKSGYVQQRTTYTEPETATDNKLPVE